MEILIILLLILLNGIFSMSEIALVSSKKYKLGNAAQKGDANAKRALDLANNPNKFLSTVQLGITLVGILTGIFSGEKIAADLTAAIAKIEALSAYAHSIAVFIIVVIVTFLSIVFGELIPKRIGMAFPEKIASVVAGPMSFLSKVTTPFIWLLSATNNLILRLFGISHNLESTASEEEIKTIIQHSTETGEIQEIEQDIVERVFALGDRKVAEIMTHRTDIVWLDANDNFETVRQKASTEPHSIYPVCDEQLDNLLGVIRSKEFFLKEFNKDNFQLRDFIKKPLVVYGNTPAYILLEKFREQKTHNAIVVDEYGSMQGIVSLDDILDALVGDISDHDQDEYKIVKRDNSSWLVDGQYPYFEFLNYFEATDEETEGDFNTVAGLILHSIGRIPEVGEKITWKDFTIEIIDLDGMRIDKVMVTKQSEAS
ncbi:MAG: hypothetical protein K0Q79_3377 [Flavipsychrobacter sp.]|jgi:putative hemolysin|nr:hypothetical protein [Flavipsychrobacter sp.]